MSILIGLTIALGFTLCALEYGKPIGKYIFKKSTIDTDRWVEEDPVRVTLRLPEPPKQMPKPKPQVATASLVTDVISIIDNSIDLKNLPEFEIDPDEVYIPTEYIEAPDVHVYEWASVMPEFPGGEEGLMRYLNEVLTYPSFARENNIQGPVYIQFIVDRFGNVDEESIEILGSPHAVLSKEAIRAIKNMPQWTPGKQNFRSVAVNMKMPIKFRLN